MELSNKRSLFQRESCSLDLEQKVLVLKNGVLWKSQKQIPLSDFQFVKIYPRAQEKSYYDSKSGSFRKRTVVDYPVVLEGNSQECEVDIAANPKHARARAEEIAKASELGVKDELLAETSVREAGTLDESLASRLARQDYKSDIEFQHLPKDFSIENRGRLVCIHLPPLGYSLALKTLSVLITVGLVVITAMPFYRKFQESSLSFSSFFDLAFSWAVIAGLGYVFYRYRTDPRSAEVSADEVTLIQPFFLNSCNRRTIPLSSLEECTKASSDKLVFRSDHSWQELPNLQGRADLVKDMFQRSIVLQFSHGQS